jgi:hypothetical protein
VEIAAAKAAQPLNELRAGLEDAPAPRSFAEALRRPEVCLIAEVKKARPRAACCVQILIRWRWRRTRGRKSGGDFRTHGRSTFRGHWSI